MNCTMNDILNVVAREFLMTTDDLKKRTRETRISGPRQIVMWVARDVTKLSLTQIGEKLGGFDHTTVMHGVRTVEAKMANDEKFAAQVRRLAHDAVVRTAHRVNNIQTAAYQPATT